MGRFLDLDGLNTLVTQMKGWVTEKLSGYAKTSHTHSYLPLSGGNVNGCVSVTVPSGSVDTYRGLRINIAGSGMSANLVMGGQMGSVSGAGTGVYSMIVYGQQFKFRHNTTDVMTVTPAGNVGVGVSSPAYKLDVGGTARFSGNVRVNGEFRTNVLNHMSSDDVLTIGDSSNESYINIVEDVDSGNWGITQGGIANFKTVNQSSDARLKENVRGIDDSFVAKLFGTQDGLLHTFEWKDDGQTSNGMIAQELMEYMPEVVSYDDKKDKYSVDYTSALCKIVGAMFVKLKEIGG